MSLLSIANLKSSTLSQTTFIPHCNHQCRITSTLHRKYLTFCNHSSELYDVGIGELCHRARFSQEVALVQQTCSLPQSLDSNKHRLMIAPSSEVDVFRRDDFALANFTKLTTTDHSVYGDVSHIDFFRHLFNALSRISVVHVGFP